jgi:hypothetical protein
MEIFIKENFKMEIVKEKENILGQMKVFIKENGLVIK